MKNKLFESCPSTVLDTAYAVNTIGASVAKLEQDLKGFSMERHGSQQAKAQPLEPPEQMLLSKADGILIADCLQVPEIAPEVERAVWQIEREIRAREGEAEDGRSKTR